jgi:hypothetical protein
MLKSNEVIAPDNLKEAYPYRFGECPFCHHEKSFFRSMTQDIYYCYNCKQAGDWAPILTKKDIIDDAHTSCRNAKQEALRMSVQIIKALKEEIRVLKDKYEK